jgi:excisionase family DNA binding protein
MASSVQYLDVHHVSKRLKIPERTVRDRARKGRLPGVKIGRKIWYFVRAEIEAICAQTASDEEH